MRPPSGRLFNLTVTVRRRTWTSDASGGRVPSTGSAASVAASAQPLSVERTPEHLRATGKVAYQVHFASDPGVDVDDLVELPDGSILSVAGPALDEAGRGAMWTAYALRIS